MKRERDTAELPELPALPWELWRLIIECTGIHLVLEPVCHEWLAVAEEYEQASLAQWVHEVADAGPVRNCAGELDLMASPRRSHQNYQGDCSPYDWCRQLRGIPGILDRHFCRAVRRVIRLNEWLAANEIPWGLKAVPHHQRLLDNLYMLWRDHSVRSDDATKVKDKDITPGAVLRVVPRQHYNHLLRRPRDLDAAGSAVGPVPLEDHLCTEADVCIGSGPLLQAIPLTRLRDSVLTRGCVVGWATEERRIETAKHYRTLEDAECVAFVYVPEAGEQTWPLDEVVRYVRNLQYWAQMCRAVCSSYQSKVKLAKLSTSACNVHWPVQRALAGVWYQHCRRLSDETRQAYHDMVARGERHWSFVDCEMADQICDLICYGVLVVDARSTRVHAPLSFSEAELEQEEAPRAYLRAYMPSQFLRRLHLPDDIFYGTAAIERTVRSGEEAANSNNRRIAWPDMTAQRGHQVPWERQNYGLERLPALLQLELIEFVDERADRADGYLYATLLGRCRQNIGAPAQWSFDYFW